MNQQNNKNNKNKISLILLTKNESENIKANYLWLNNCKIINELIVIDDNSTDDTIKQINNLKKQKTKIFKKTLNNNFSAQHTFAIKNCSNNWILWLDADEKPTKKLINFLNNFSFPQNINSFSFKRSDYFLGKKLKYGETGHLDFIRLFDKNYGKFTGKIHETWNNTGTNQKTKLIITHYSHKNLKGLIKKINFYTSIRSKELFDQKTKTSLIQIIFYPLIKFIQNYFLKLGFLDSTQGIIMALSMSFHSFLVRAKLWHLWQLQSHR
ncbi:glycosyltransferase family 2 protein [Patescibacteria group bacterium]|nr:glycosyltransferase family 2 protein [Patescibacteria group bacterium]